MNNLYAFISPIRGINWRFLVGSGKHLLQNFLRCLRILSLHIRTDMNDCSTERCILSWQLPADMRIPCVLSRAAKRKKKGRWRTLALKVYYNRDRNFAEFIFRARRRVNNAEQVILLSKLLSNALSRDSKLLNLYARNFETNRWTIYCLSFLLSVSYVMVTNRVYFDCRTLMALGHSVARHLYRDVFDGYFVNRREAFMKREYELNLAKKIDNWFI